MTHTEKQRIDQMLAMMSIAHKNADSYFSACQVESEGKAIHEGCALQVAALYPLVVLITMEAQQTGKSPEDIFVELATPTIKLVEAMKLVYMASKEKQERAQ